jgi:hypothetical protein
MAHQFTWLRNRIEQCAHGFPSAAAVVSLMPPESFRAGDQPICASESMRGLRLKAKCPTNRRLGDAAVKCGDDSRQFLCIDCDSAPTAPTTTASRGKACSDPLRRQVNHTAHLSADARGLPTAAFLFCPLMLKFGPFVSSGRSKTTASGAGFSRSTVRDIDGTFVEAGRIGESGYA